MHISEFVTYTFDIFPRLKNTVGDKAAKKDKPYSLSDSQALSVYIRNHNKGKKSKFSDRDKAFLLNKCRYFIYPELREKPYKNKDGKELDITINDFSDMCVNLFFLRLGVDFSYLRIEKGDETEFANQQKKCLEDLFFQTVELLTHDKTQACPKEEMISFLQFLFLKYRYHLLTQIEPAVFIKYFSYTKKESENFVTYPAIAFHELKRFYPAKGVNYMIGVEEYFKDLNNKYDYCISRFKEMISFVENEIEKENEDELSWSSSTINMNLQRAEYSNLFETIILKTMYFDDYLKSIEHFSELCDRLAHITDRNIICLSSFYDFCSEVFMIHMYILFQCSKRTLSQEES